MKKGSKPVRATRLSQLGMLLILLALAVLIIPLWYTVISKPYDFSYSWQVWSLWVFGGVALVVLGFAMAVSAQVLRFRSRRKQKMRAQ